VDTAKYSRLDESAYAPSGVFVRQLGWSQPSARLLGWLVAVVVLFTSGTAFAQGQPWLGDRKFRGAGIRTGNLELHPGVAGEVGFDSNFAQGSGDQGPVLGTSVLLQEPVVPSLRLRVTPSLSLSTLGPQRSPQGQAVLPPKITFNADLALRLNQLVALGSEYGEGTLSRTLFDGDLALQTEILPRRPWSLGVNALVARVAQPSNDPSVPSAALSRTTVGGGTDLRWRPGGGTLEWSVGYDGSYTTFDEAALGLDFVDHGPNIKGRWTFLPQTALLYDGRMGFVSYVSTANRRLVDSRPMVSTLGINGLITARIAFLAQGGWKATFFNGNTVADYDGLIGRLEATWFIASEPSSEGARGFSTLKLGYFRNVTNSGISNYYILDKVYADLAYGAFGNLFLNARLGVGFVKHPRSTLLVLDGDTFAPADVHEFRPEASISGDYRLTQNVALIGSLGYVASIGDNIIMVPQQRDLRDYADNLSFSRFTALVGARWFL
jgi:hypothetical protein